MAGNMDLRCTPTSPTLDHIQTSSSNLQFSLNLLQLLEHLFLSCFLQDGTRDVTVSLHATPDSSSAAGNDKNPECG